MSINASKDLIDLIDSRITAKKYQRVAVVESVSEDNKTAIVRFPETDTTFEFYNKTGEVLAEKDSVYIASNDGDLMNGYIQNRFGESSWLKVGKELEIDPGTIGEDELADGAVTGDKIADFSVTNAHIVNASIDNAKIKRASIDTAKIRDATITTAKIQDAAITNAKIENAAIDNAKIGIAAIDTANIKNAAITTACIGDAAITTTQIADGSVTDAKIVNLTANKITAGTIDAGTITVVNLDAANITVGKINGVQIEDGAIGLAKLDAIVNDKIATAQATADGKNTIFYHGEEPTSEDVKLNDTWFDIDDGYKMYTYNGTVWVAAPFGTSAIDDSAVTGTKLANGTITGVKMIDGAITAREIATGAIIADKLATNSVTANAIEAKSINAGHIDTNTITADKLLLGDNTNFSTVWLSQYTTDDWADWTGMIFPTATKDANDYVYPSLTTNTDFLFSMPFDATALTTVTAENSFGFKFTTNNSSATDKTALLNVYFFGSAKNYLNKTTLETLSLTGSTVQGWDLIKTVAKNTNAKYFCFGINITGGFTGMFKDIQARRSVGSTFINNGSITTDKIVSSAITTDKVAARSIIANKIASNTITAAEIAAGVITADEIAANAITAAKIKAGEITATKLVAGTITANEIASRTITAEKMVTGTITANEIKAETITADKIAARAITAEKIAAQAISCDKIYGGTLNFANITATNRLYINTGSVTAGISMNASGKVGSIYANSTRGLTLESSSGGIYIGGQDGAATYMSTAVTVVGNLTAPNIIYTASSGTEKISDIKWISSGTYVQVGTVAGAKGITVWSSDRKWKTNIIDSQINALQRIDKIKPRSFNWIETGSYEDCGFIAQEIEEAIGENHVLKVSQENGDIDYQILEKGFIPLLTKGIQELNTKTNESTAKLQNEIAILWLTCKSQQEEINQLKADIELIKSMIN